MQNKKLWFRAKRYGLGWYPVSWEGWVVIFLYALSLIKIFLYTDATSYSVTDILINVLAPILLLTILLIIICYKMGEKPGWHWGEPRNSGPEVQDL